MSRSRFLSASLALMLGLGSGAALADTVVQIPLPGLLDARSVTTFTDGQLVVFTLPTDGGNLQNAFATAAVAQQKGKPVENALPDDGRFPSNARHPEVVLSFSNAAPASSPQTHLVPPSGSFSFAVPEATYSKLYLFFNGAAGGTTIEVTLSYADATDSHEAMIPDYYADISADDPVLFNLATNLAKWDKNSAINEASHHNITGVTLEALPGKVLQSVKVERSAMGNLVFWGATGIATSEVSGAGGGGGMGGAGGSAGGGAAGTAGAASGGVSGSSGQQGGAAGMSGGGFGTSGGGVAGSAGASGSAAMATAGNAQATDTKTDSGCSCRVVRPRFSTSSAAWLVGAVIVWRRVRRARRKL